MHPGGSYSFSPSLFIHLHPCYGIILVFSSPTNLHILTSSHCTIHLLTSIVILIALVSTEICNPSSLSHFPLSVDLNISPVCFATMLPPTDSVQHQILRLRALFPSTQEPQTSPPAYSPTNPMTPALYEDHLTDEEDYGYPESRPAPITINIDASLKIEGHANTIFLPPASSPTSSPSSSATPSPAAISSRPCYQNGRVEKVTSMVLAALKEADLFKSARAMDGGTTSRQVEISVNAGIVLKGSRNTVCSGLPKLIKRTGAPATAREKPDPRIGEESAASGTRKRRACSVCGISVDGS